MSATREASHVRAVNQLFGRDVQFLKAAVGLEGLPQDNITEVAFAGRSNVGKSSLINAVTGRASLARTSGTPGRTQQLILFDIGQPVRLRIIDMPGYGYAQAPKPLVAAWGQLVRNYLRGRQNLQRVLLLIDSRHGAKESDIEMMQMLDAAAVSYQLILTKGDKLSSAAQMKAVEAATAVARAQTAAYPDVVLTSSDKGWGIDIVRNIVANFAINRLGNP